MNQATLTITTGGEAPFQPAVSLNTSEKPVVTSGQVGTPLSALDIEDFTMCAIRTLTASTRESQTPGFGTVEGWTSSVAGSTITITKSTTGETGTANDAVAAITFTSAALFDEGDIVSLRMVQDPYFHLSVPGMTLNSVLGVAPTEGGYYILAHDVDDDIAVTHVDAKSATSETVKVQELLREAVGNPLLMVDNGHSAMAAAMLGSGKIIVVSSRSVSHYVHLLDIDTHMAVPLNTRTSDANFDFALQAVANNGLNAYIVVETNQLSGDIYTYFNWLDDEGGNTGTLDSFDIDFTITHAPRGHDGTALFELDAGCIYGVPGSMAYQNTPAFVARTLDPQGVFTLSSAGDTLTYHLYTDGSDAYPNAATGDIPATLDAAVQDALTASGTAAATTLYYIEFLRTDDDGDFHYACISQAQTDSIVFEVKRATGISNINTFVFLRLYAGLTIDGTSIDYSHRLYTFDDGFGNQVISATKMGVGMQGVYVNVGRETVLSLPTSVLALTPDEEPFNVPVTVTEPKSAVFAWWVILLIVLGILSVAGGIALTVILVKRARR